MQKFCDYYGNPVTLSYIVDSIDKNFEYDLMIGTDSHVHRAKKKVLYATCIVLHKKYKGGTIFVSQEWSSLANSLRQRLTHEVWRSLEVALSLQNLLPPNVEIVVDLDLNKRVKYKSSNYVEGLVGMVTAQGFKCRIKPDSWAAMKVADRFSK